MKDEIKAWLKTHNHEREWLAEQIGVKKRTVDNWLSSPKEIPLGKLSMIERLMEDDASAESTRRQKLNPLSQVYSLEVDLPTFRQFSKAALAQQRTLEQWSVHELEKAAKSWEQSQIGLSLDNELAAQTDEAIEPINQIDDDLQNLFAKRVTQPPEQGIALLAETPQEYKFTRKTYVAGGHSQDTIRHDSSPSQHAAQEHNEP